LNEGAGGAPRGFACARPTQSMRFALVETDTLVFVGFHAAVFVAVVVVLLAVQWLFERRR
jgi:hypothetical protein